MHPPTPSVTRKIDLYDHKTRQRKAYDRPSGLVEKMNMKNTVCIILQFIK
jgi:hypothetical protein